MSHENVELALQVMSDAYEGIFGQRFDALFDPAIDFRDELGTLDNRDDLRADTSTAIGSRSAASMSSWRKPATSGASS